MANFWQRLLDLLRLRAGPQDLPADRGLTIMALGIFLAQGVMVGEALARPVPAEETLLGFLVQFGAVALILVTRRTPERIQQTFLAFAATGTALSFLALPFLLQANPEVDQPGLALVWFGIFGWSLAVAGNIFRHALQVTLPIGILVSVVLLAFERVVVELALR